VSLIVRTFRSTIPPHEGLVGGASGLRLLTWGSTRLPGFPVALRADDLLPLTVAGPRRTHTGFRTPRSLVRKTDVQRIRNLTRVSVPS
jgi:hypothetical protein